MQNRSACRLLKLSSGLQNYKLPSLIVERTGGQPGWRTADVKSQTCLGLIIYRNNVLHYIPKILLWSESGTLILQLESQENAYGSGRRILRKCGKKKGERERDKLVCFPFSVVYLSFQIFSKEIFYVRSQNLELRFI